MRTRQTGVAAVEFALILPFLLILSFITIEFGRALYSYNTLVKSVRDAARYLSTQTPWVAGDPDTKVVAAPSTTIGDVKLRAKNLIVFGNPTGSGPPLASGLAASQVTDPVWTLRSIDPTVGPVINTVTIKISGYIFSPMIASAFGLTFANIPFADIGATMRGSL